MTKENKDILMKLLRQHKELGISEQIDFDKFYLYSIITHSTAIEGSTVTEVCYSTKASLAVNVPCWNSR